MKTTLTVLLIINLYGLTSCAIKEHYYIDLEKNWTDALQYCTTNYYNLSSFSSETEMQDFLIEDAVIQTSDAWVGISTINDEWVWSGFIPVLLYSLMDENLEHECAVLSGDDDELSTENCSDTLPFFCMDVTEVVVIQQTESWEGALDYCRDHYDDLASLNSNRSMTDALSKISGSQTQYMWIGLRFLAGNWFWISGDDLQYQVWSSPGQLQCPEQNQRCAALDKITKTWTPRDCEEKLNFLCFAQPEDQHLSGTYPTVVSQGCQDCIQNQNTNVADKS